MLTRRVGPEDEAPYSVIRHRCVDRVWIEEIKIVNHRRATTAVRVELEFDADFGDQEQRRGRREVTWRVDGA